MISPELEALSSRLKDRFRHLSDATPALALDDTWPTIGVVDALTFPFRGLETLPVEFAGLMAEVSAYIGCLVSQCWAALGAETNVRMSPTGLEIVGQGGQLLTGGSQFSVRIEHYLRQILRDVPREFPVLGDFTRTISQDSEIISLFTLGLCSGLSSFGEGPWTLETVESFSPNIDKVVRQLALSSAKHYEHLYPQESLGQVPEIYLEGLLYPPTLMREGLPIVGAVEPLSQFIQSNKVPPIQVKRFAANLARSADERLSCVGLSLYFALTDSEVDPFVIAAAQRRGQFTGLLRLAMTRFREQLLGVPDIFKPGEITKDVVSRFAFEIEAGFYPWIRLPKKRLSDAKIFPIILALATFDFDSAVKLCDILIDVSPGDTDIRFQRLYLELINGDIESGLVGSRLLLGEPGCEDDPNLYHLLGLCSLHLDRMDDAVAQLERACSFAPPDFEEKYKLYNDLGWALTLAGRADEAIAVLDRAIISSRCPITAMLNKMHALKESGQSEKQRMLRSQLLLLAPLDRRVVSNLVLGYL